VYELRVRYGECDMQGVVFNAHYLAYVDDAIDRWFVDRIGRFDEVGFDCMVKRAAVEWSSPARWGETLSLVPSVSRWGTSSFDVTVTGAVGHRPVFSATVVYISVQPGSHTPCPVPGDVREALSGPG
jgi:acyl-CoA thioester hydrolase